jgi:antitoxin YefM
MNTVTFNKAQAHFKRITQSVADSGEPVMITRDGAPAVVLMAGSEYSSLMETMYLTSSRTNALRLLNAVDAFESKAR